jgi:hypothetical protein
MPGKTITDNQYRLYIQTRKSAHTQKISATKVGFSERTGRRLEKRGLTFSGQQKRQKAGDSYFF